MASYNPWKSHSTAKQIQQFLRKEISPQNGEMLIILKQLGDIHALLEEYHERVNYLETAKNAIIFCGIPEKKREDVTAVILEFIWEFLQVKISPLFIKRCFRFGDDFPRNIAMVCKYQGVVQEVWSRKYMLKYSPFFMEKIDTSEFEKPVEESEFSAGYWENPDTETQKYL